MPVPTDITAGTISITGTTVTGVGTSFLASDIRQGDLFVWVETGAGRQQPIVQTVNSNTSITLAEPWTGADVPAGSRYRLRYQWDSSRVSAQARQLIELLDGGNLSSIAGLDGTGGDKGVMFNGPGSATTFSLTAFARTLLDDSNAAAAISTLGLFPVQSSVIDDTADRLLRTGAFGVGKTVSLASPNLNDVRPSGLYYCNSPTNGPGGNGWLRFYDLTSDFAYQEFTPVGTTTVWRNARSSGAWSGWSANTRVGAVKIRTFTASGTYTPDPKLLYAVIEAVGGGGGGGAVQGGTTSGASSGGGGSGGYSAISASRATIGSSRVVTIGAGGAGSTSAASSGAAGSDTSVGTLCIARGGGGGGSSNGATTGLGSGGTGAVAGTGTLTFGGSAGQGGSVSLPGVGLVAVGGLGGGSYYGGGGRGVYTATGGAGTAPGAGGGGTALLNSSGLQAGGAGASGIVVITEYCEE